MGVKSYKDLIVWQKSMELVGEVHRLAKYLPKEELYGLSDQMRRAAVSIPSNIAEGQARNSQKEFAQFLHIARGSKAELETQLYICVRLGFMTDAQIMPALGLCEEIGKMINSILTTIRS
jgi:four helix bundle protein